MFSTMFTYSLLQNHIRHERGQPARQQTKAPYKRAIQSPHTKAINNVLISSVEVATVIVLMVSVDVSNIEETGTAAELRSCV